MRKQSSVTSGDNMKWENGSLNYFPPISVVFFLFILLFLFLLILFCSARHQLQRHLQGASHAADPACNLQLGSWQFPSHVLYGWKAHTAAPPGAGVSMGTGSVRNWVSAFFEMERFCTLGLLSCFQEVKRLKTNIWKKVFGDIKIRCCPYTEFHLLLPYFLNQVTQTSWNSLSFAVS